MLADEESKQSCVISEVQAYGDVVLRFVSGSSGGPFLPGYEAVDGPQHTFGLQRLDHCVCNAPRLFEVTDYLMKVTGVSTLTSAVFMQHALYETTYNTHVKSQCRSE